MRSFHDAVIVGVEAAVEHLVLRIEDVTVDRRGVAEHESGRLHVQRVTTVEEEGSASTCAAVGSGFDDGQILELSMNGGLLWMIVVWQNYSTCHSRTVEHRIVGGRISWEPDSPSRG